MNLTYLWFQIDQLPFFSRVIGGAGLLGIMAWFLSFPLLLFKRFWGRVERLNRQYREGLAIKVNHMRATHRWGFLFASAVLQDFNGRAHSFLLMHSSGGSNTVLISSKERCRLGREALSKLRRSPSEQTRIYAINVLARLQPQGTWKAIAPYLRRPDSPEFFPASKALLQIDMPRALRIILRLGMNHTSVNRHLLGRLLQDLPAPGVEEAFIHLLVEGGFAGEPRLIALMPYLGEGGRLMPLRSFLPLQNRMAWLKMAIRLVDSPSQLPLVRPFLDHPDHEVRFYAARALGKHGVKTDLPALKGMMFRESPSVRSAAKTAYVSIMSRIATPSFPEQEATGS
jgi:HEAT repeats